MGGDAVIGGLDLGVVIAYFALIIGFGAWAARHSRGLTDFLLGGQRFAWWLVAFSCVATVVGSYSFVKYSAAGFRFGISSSQTYLNDWFWMPLWMFGWLPLVYYGRITSVPEYFGRRFGPLVRQVAMLLLLLYLLGYLGINFLTMGTALEAMVGWPLLASAAFAALICGIYTSHGGQTAVIFTDLLQGALLIIAGIGLFLAGVVAVGGLGAFWQGLGPDGRHALPAFNTPADFNFVGIFWQDGMAGGIAFYFINQGILLRFLSARSLAHARRAAVVVLLVLMPLAAVAVSGAGWIGRVMVAQGALPATTPAAGIFVTVADRILPAGLFGLVIAALVAALMSTADTLINAIATISVVDLWRPWQERHDRPGDDARALTAARWASGLATLAGLALVPLFASFHSIYRAHGTFTAAITPPLAVALLLAFCWKRVSSRAVLLVLVGGTGLIGVSFVWPALVVPFAHGIDLEAGGKAYSYIRALYGLVVCLLLGVAGTLLWPARSTPPGNLLLGPVREKMRAFKDGRRPRPEPGPRLLLTLAISGQGEAVKIHPDDAHRLDAAEGDLLAISENHWFRGGFQAFAAPIALSPDTPPGTLGAPRAPLSRLRLAVGAEVIVRREL